MHQSKDMVSRSFLLLLVAFVVAQTANSLPVTTIAPQHVEANVAKTQQHHSTAAPANHHPADSKKAEHHAATTGHPSVKPTVASVHISVTTAHPANQHNNQAAHTTAKSSAPVHHAASTHAPNGNVAVASEVKVVTTGHPSAALNHAIAASTASPKASSFHCGDAPVGKFCKYLAPVCESLDTIKPEQMFRLQTQFKTFVEKTSNKLSLCFMEQFQLDPNLVPVTKEDVNKVCASRTLAPELKGSYGVFERCASNNWDVALEKELDRINSARDNGAKNHKHDKSTGASHILSHDEDGMVVLNDVVSKILDPKAGASDIKVVDVGKPEAGKQSGPGQQQAVITAVDPKAPANGVPKTQAEAAKMMSDPNTVVVLVDDSTGKAIVKNGPLPALKVNAASASTAAPILAAAVAPAAVAAAFTTAAPVTTPTLAPATATIAPAGLPAKPRDRVEQLGDNIMAGLAEQAMTAPAHANLSPSTTAKPAAESTGKPAAATVSAVNTTGKPAEHTTGKPAIGKTSTIAPKATNVAGSSPAPHATTAKPAGSTKAPESKASGSSAAPAAKSTTAKPAQIGGSSTAKPATGSTTKPPAGEPSTTTTKAPAKENHSTTKAPDAGKSSSTTAKPTAASKAKKSSTTTNKPSDKSGDPLDDLIKKSDKIKQDAQGKMKDAKEKAAKAIKKGESDSDAKAAAKSLQSTREKGHKTDSRLHQLEHDRQMAIDPVGHTMKHQQYAASKGNKANQ